MKKFEEGLTDKSRFHALYIIEDKVPRMLRYLDKTESAKLDVHVSEKVRSQISSEEVTSVNMHPCPQANGPAGDGANYFFFLSTWLRHLAVCKLLSLDLHCELIQLDP